MSLVVAAMPMLRKSDSSVSNVGSTADMNTIEEDVKELFDMVYMWGNAGVVADEHAPAFKKKLLEIAREVEVYER